MTTVGGTNLELWSKRNGTGDSKPGSATQEPRCVLLDDPFQALSARNDSTFDAELFLDSSCTGAAGAPVWTVPVGGKTENFERAHKVTSVNFAKPVVAEKIS